MLVLKLLLCITFVVSYPVSLDLSQSLDFQVISSNVRTDTKWRFCHEHRWKERKVQLIQTLHHHATSKLPTLIGLQEVKHNQLMDLEEGLNHLTDGKDWDYFGVGRDNGKKKGEYAPIFYRKSQWELLNGTTEWLSPTPRLPSKAWGAADVRIVTITTFKNKETGIIINMLNTHFDHKSQLARGKSSKLILDWIHQIPNDHETFVSGDFNSQSSDASYKTLIQDLSDTRKVSRVKDTQMATYTGFEPEDPSTVIDFVWCAKDANKENSHTSVNKYNVLDTWTERGYRYSDHRPVVVEFSVKPR
ncbi:hypothetical protein PSN45_004527 [Yamadazyma tenuis]|uniref:DNase I-like protein n=1 Tax=Candida tenuis (strain ATCC 10573 / BCRC 21748 / CBS 615 / JCM 9827 / NBRC 10315 / NRRL Y-1498 / VKM Y-70) TaxID=590646 RepID=G3B5D9_CANTC|nr:DNase I-like protein [Yamadazyma tenuis ATCC 10573]XP_006687376.1 uncharacterized protein CANTEDRAFT_114510 [Yamadazyma tenuis ATCC 10573]EGV63582.1 DNase I-like protein [Yamadazyma tenuis ATCC 10573]EGV63583.1 hypothetical protein CANTEDRAFT_114510 [Yamadazyma tenuis ATCC 10573]WEJ96981.1 hypothetical protein PSN45_004527 [Yamadazyma tenuis]